MSERRPASIPTAALRHVVLVAALMSSSSACGGSGDEPPPKPLPRESVEIRRSAQPAAVPVEPAPETDAAPARRPVRPVRERIIDFYTIGGGSNNAETRNVGYVNSRGGWSAFVDRHARRSYDYGVRRIWLHCPFGTIHGEPFDLDQFVLAEEAGLGFLVDDFTEVWAPVVDGRHFGEPVEVVAYLGTVAVRPARSGPNVLQRMRDEGRADLWLERAVRSVVPAIRAGMSIGFDTATDEPDHPPDNFQFAFCALLRSLGVQVYVEPRPQRRYPGWHDFDILTIDRFWLRSDPDRHPDASWAARNDQLSGEIIRLVFVPRGTEGDQARIDELAEHVRGVLRDGDSVAMNLKVFREGGWPMERLVAGIGDDRRADDPPSSAEERMP